MNPQEFQSILPCYFGQKILTKNNKVGAIHEVFSTDSNQVNITCYDLPTSYYVIGEFKLILRKMSDMTDEENEKLDITAEGCITIQGFNYLRSIGIDCDGLIEAGFAVHKKTISNQYHQDNRAQAKKETT